MSYETLKDYIVDTVDTVITGYDITDGTGLDYDDFIKGKGANNKSCFVSFDGFTADTAYENSEPELFTLTTRVYLRTTVASEILSDVRAVVNKYAGDEYKYTIGLNTYTSSIKLESGTPSRERGRDIWEIQFTEIRGLI